MMTLLGLLALFSVIWFFGSIGDWPRETNADVWNPDPVKRARNLRLALQAWRNGTPYVNPDALAELTARFEHAKSTPLPKPFVAVRADDGEDSPRRLVRCCKMHAPHWE